MPRLEATIKTRDGLCPASLFTPAEGAGPWPAVIFFMDGLGIRPLGRDVDAIIVDFHCEATGEKQAMGHFCDGRVSLVVGTHTHTPSADHRVLAGGTAYITDVGMTGDYDSVVGMQKEEPVRRFATGVTFGRFLPAEGAASMCGVAVETDPATGLATCIAPVRLGGPIEQRTPGFWE